MHKLVDVGAFVPAAAQPPVRVLVAHVAADTLLLVDVMWRLLRAARSTRPKSAR